MQENPDTELTERQIYRHWANLNEESWKLDHDQLQSAIKVLKAVDGMTIETIPIQVEDGIAALAFAFKEILDDFSKEILEIAMDSTCKLKADLSSKNS